MNVQHRILWAEDGKFDRLIVTNAIKALDLDCYLDLVTSGEEACRLCEETQNGVAFYQLLVLDMHLPGKSGIETLTQIRTLSAYRDTNAFFFTASRDMENVRRAVELKAKGYFTKPKSCSEYSLVVQAIVTTGLAYANELARSPLPDVLEGNT